MNLLLTIVAFLVIFSLLILVHEFGHFYMAKRHGIKVEEFGFGLPPRIWGKKKGETLYSLNWIPFGGFVRMLGEDGGGKAAKNPRSFMRKTKWQRTQVVCAGVVMNLLFAWVLLTVGFLVGMQPLILDANQFLDQVAAGNIKIESGVVVDEVTPGSWAESVGFQAGDRVETLNGEPIETLQDFSDALASGDAFTVDDQTFTPSEEAPSAGLLFNVIELPRVVVSSTVEGSPMESGDVIESVNGEPIFFSDDFLQAVLQSPSDVATFEVLRDGQPMTLEWSLSPSHRAFITQVLSDSPAESGGLLAGDVVWSINGQDIWVPSQAAEAVQSTTEETVVYQVQRNGEILSYVLSKNEQGLVGILLTTLYTPSVVDFIYYDGTELVSITDVQPVTYSWTKAPIEALSEIKRLGSYTVVMIAQVFGHIFTTGDVPEGVAGPVGIAQMTHLYVQEGFIALVRFTALLSLSLAVINIFPFPALDGGRFLFILIEAVRGKPINGKLEGIIHGLGFTFLLIVIFLVTFQDLQRLFGAF